jgi:polyphosphate kinase
MNALVDPVVIRELYGASQAGVEIELMIRGICCLRPGVPGVSEGIEVRSVVDQYLEHARVFAFGPGDKADVFISSADWMPRNFLRRIDVMVPVQDPELRRRILQEVLDLGFQDNTQAWRLQADGRYARLEGADSPVRSQEEQFRLVQERTRSRQVR